MSVRIEKLSQDYEGARCFFKTPGGYCMRKAVSLIVYVVMGKRTGHDFMCLKHTKMTAKSLVIFKGRPSY